jgi:hypothetical protein
MLHKIIVHKMRWHRTVNIVDILLPMYYLCIQEYSNVIALP